MAGSACRLSKDDKEQRSPEAVTLPIIQYRQARRRKRALRACLTCRARKVRCHVTVLGEPCTNCRFNEQECIMAEGNSRKYKTNPLSLPTFHEVQYLIPVTGSGGY